ncbi:MAG: AAA family ATPase [Crocinitomicaceae bacterium]|nr:AAA family ATPase [Crocinitomicaceae bacterium]
MHPRILNRIQKWNAILLFDEVDIFLSRRNENLERSAIVGIFLRLFEYFNGILFFTTNRINSLDEAVLSRVTLKINYPKLDEVSREKVWKQNLNAADLITNSLSKLALIEMNGREIRNYVKLASMLFEKEVNEAEIIELIEKFPKN